MLRLLNVACFHPVMKKLSRRGDDLKIRNGVFTLTCATNNRY
jgi:hypothetical protein